MRRCASMWCPRRDARSWRSAEMSIGATTMRSPGPGDASASSGRRSRRPGSARPRVRRIVPQARALVGGRRRTPCSRCARARLIERPPVHRLGGAPGVHVGRHADQHLGAVGGQLAHAPRETASRSRSRSRCGQSACRPPGTAARRSRAGRAGCCAPRTGSTGFTLRYL